MTPQSVNYDILTPVKFLKRSADVYPGKTAVVYGENRYSYQAFQSRIYRLANALRKAGIGKGDKVAFICPNTPPMLEAHYAVPLIGAVLVSVNIRLASTEIGYILNHSESKALFVDTEFAPSVEPILEHCPNIGTIVNICDIHPEKPLGDLEYEAFLSSATDDPIPCAITSEEDLIALNYTSGTTGQPKGVMYHHRGAYLNAMGEVIAFGLDNRSVYLWTLPMFHCNGWCFTWAVTAVGGMHVCLRKVVPEEIYATITRESVSHLCAAPTVLIGLANHPGAEETRMKRALNIMTAGAPPSPTVIENMEAMGANVTQTYGLTEVFGPHSICEWQSHWDGLPGPARAKLKARQGVPYIHALHMDVVDAKTMIPVPRDGQTIGEIVMRGNNVMAGYYKDPTATAKAFEGGWFHSGDLAVIHPDGYIQIMDRKKDIIISGGENISTVEVENVIYSHPDVLEVAVIPIPDPKWGEVPKAFIVPKQDARLTAEDIIRFCKQHLARFKAPKEIEFSELPKTATGKIRKFKLMEKEWKGRNRIAA